ncbi:hypothetical protein BaRGS_00019142 [Batillaria attramentaria]|uniref:Uncharacterized protein n=1 Tax=Batillaria attramentaria TaxID=370345 RepID=A0ABD0KSL7_9CAEN
MLIGLRKSISYGPTPADDLESVTPARPAGCPATDRKVDSISKQPKLQCEKVCDGGEMSGKAGFYTGPEMSSDMQNKPHSNTCTYCRPDQQQRSGNGQVVCITSRARTEADVRQTSRDYLHGSSVFIFKLSRDAMERTRFTGCYFVIMITFTCGLCLKCAVTHDATCTYGLAQCCRFS